MNPSVFVLIFPRICKPIYVKKDILFFCFDLDESYVCLVEMIFMYRNKYVVGIHVRIHIYGFREACAYCVCVCERVREKVCVQVDDRDREW